MIILLVSIKSQKEIMSLGSVTKDAAYENTAVHSQSSSVSVLHAEKATIRTLQVGTINGMVPTFITASTSDFTLNSGLNPNTSVVVANRVGDVALINFQLSVSSPVSSGTVLFTVPAGFSPLAQIAANTLFDDSGQLILARVILQTDGTALIITDSNYPPQTNSTITGTLLYLVP